MKKKILTIIFSSLLFVGCAIKKEDSTATKTLKHTVNSPAYVGAALVKTAELVILSPFALLSSFNKNSVEKKLEVLKDYEKNNKLRSKKIFIKDYTNEFNIIAMKTFSDKLKNLSNDLNFNYEINKSLKIPNIKDNLTKTISEYRFPDGEYIMAISNEYTEKIEKIINTQTNAKKQKFKIDSIVKFDKNGSPILVINKKYNNIVEAYVDYLYINRTLIDYAKYDSKLYNISLYLDYDKFEKEKKLEMKFFSNILPNRLTQVENHFKYLGAEIVKKEKDADIIFHTQFIGTPSFISIKKSETLLDKYFSNLVPKKERDKYRFNYIALDNTIDFKKEVNRLLHKRDNKLSFIQYHKKNKPFKSANLTLFEGYVDFKDSNKDDKPIFGGDYTFAAKLYYSEQKYQNMVALLFASELLEANDDG